MPRADLVLEGGGVKGLGTVGAVTGLLDAGWTFPRVAGTSVGALAAAFAAAGADAGTFRAVLGRLDLRRIPDRRAPLPVISEGVSLLLARGAYEGDWIRDWLLRELDRLGVRTFADLRRADAGDDPTAGRYRLVVMATDVTHGRLLRLPWDYRLFDLEPDDQLVADAVRMSLSIPFYFRPCALRHGSTGEVATIVDGGVLSNFPIEIFDRTDGRPPRWPTFGVRLFPDLPAGLGDVVPWFGVPALPAVRLLEQVVATALVGRDQTHLDRPGVRDRTMTVDTSGTAITEFGIGEREKAALAERGRSAAREFLNGWEGGRVDAHDLSAPSWTDRRVVTLASAGMSSSHDHGHDHHHLAGPPSSGSEVVTLLGSLERQRRTLAWKCGDLDAEGMRATVGPSTMTLGGLLKHLALIEDYTFATKFLGRSPGQPWESVDWDADEDWDWHSAADDSPEELRALWHDAVHRSRAIVEAALQQGGLDQPGRVTDDDGQALSLRRLLVDLVEEYARHVGHADLIRESVDGLVGEDPPD